jgi:bifunctional non-homologous end joining protein LigD
MAGPLKFSDHIEGRGEEMFESVGELGLEGVVAKKADSPYREGRTTAWYRIRHERTGDFVIAGYTPPKRGRTAFGALHLAVCDGPRWIYAGRVGTGFSDQQLREIRLEMDERRTDDPPYEGAPEGKSGDTWIDPQLVCEVRYKEWTRAGQLRHPVFVRMRDDKRPRECAERPAIEGLDPPVEVEEPPAAPRTVVFTNPDKVFWPEEGYTKSDLVDFYRKISPWILPYLIDRPLVLTRYPDASRERTSSRRTRRSSCPNGYGSKRCGASTPSAKFGISFVTTKRRCCTSPTWRRSRSTCGRLECRLYRTPTGASSISIPSKRRSSMW